jgi:hypothetical protein
MEAPCTTDARTVDAQMLSRVSFLMQQLPHYSQNSWHEGSWASRLLTVHVFVAQFCGNNSVETRAAAFNETQCWYGESFSVQLTRPMMKQFIRATCFPTTPVSLLPVSALPPSRALQLMHRRQMAAFQQSHEEALRACTQHAEHEQLALERSLWCDRDVCTEAPADASVAWSEAGESGARQ